jgi:hypothetical protein
MKKYISIYEKDDKSKENKELEKSCWKGYKAIGTKEKNGKTVPNCVPIKKKKKK